MDGPLRGLYYHADRWPAEQPREVDTVLGACLMVRREALEACGGLHEGYFMYSEEVEFCECVRAVGWRVLWLPQATVTHFGGASTQQVPDDMFLALYASKARFYRRNRSRLSLWLFKLGLLIAAGPRAASLLVTPVLPAADRQAWSTRGRRYARLLAALPSL